MTDRRILTQPLTREDELDHLKHSETRMAGSPFLTMLRQDRAFATQLGRTATALRTRLEADPYSKERLRKAKFTPEELEAAGLPALAEFTRLLRLPLY